MSQDQLINTLTAKGYGQALRTSDFVIMIREVNSEHTGHVIFNDGEIITLRTIDATRAANNEEINMSAYTKNQILNMPEKDRTKVYNEATGKTVKRVRDKEKAADEIIAAQKAEAPAPVKVSQSKKEDHVDLKPEPVEAIPRPRAGTACETIWMTAEAMPNAAREEVVAACVKKGINPGTAKTQYQRWKKSSAA